MLYYLSFVITNTLCDKLAEGFSEIYIEADPPSIEPVYIYENSLADFDIIPNPVNDIISISFNLNETTSLMIELCDLSGHCITTLHDGISEAGPQSFNFNLSELGISSGSYIIKLTDNNTTHSKQFIYAK